LDIKLFGKWDTKEVVIRDMGLKKYINLRPVFLPRSFGRVQYKRFGKSELNIVERLVNKIGVSGHRGKEHKFTSGRNVGKSMKAMNIVKRAFELIEERTKRNPIQVLVEAIENSAPREEITVIEHGGIRHPKAVDTSPQRRVDLALRWITQGANQRAIKNKKRIEEALAEEIIAASRNEKCFSVSKKIEMERQAAASR